MAPPEKKKPTAAVHLIAGGGAGLCEALACHPLGTFLQFTPYPTMYPFYMTEEEN